MKKGSSIRHWITITSMIGLAGICCLLGAGCASSNVNPSAPRPHTGYVDFYLAPAEDLNWDVKGSESRNKSEETLFSELRFLDENILRLAFPPGHYTFSIGFLNRVILERARVEVEVRSGEVTPVRVSLEEVGTATVKRKEIGMGGTAYGRYGRATKIRSEEDPIYRVLADVQHPLPYAVKAQVPYHVSASATPPAAQ